MVQKSKQKSFLARIYNYLKIIFGILLIVFSLLSIYGGFESSSIIWGVVIGIVFFRLGIHFVSSGYKLIHD